MSENRWLETSGLIRKNYLIRVKATLTKKASTATAAVGDFYEFNCKSKTLPTISDPPTWTDVTDNPAEPTGYAYSGKPEQLEQLEFVTRTPLPLVVGDLEKHRQGGDVFTVSYSYDDPDETNVYTETVANCSILKVKSEAGENNTGSQTTITFLPRGGTSSNMPAVSSSTRSSSSSSGGSGSST